MTSREHARRLMLILLTNEGTALRRAADERTVRPAAPALSGQDVKSSIAPPGWMSRDPAER